MKVAFVHAGCIEGFRGLYGKNDDVQDDEYKNSWLGPPKRPSSSVLLV